MTTEVRRVLYFWHFDGNKLLAAISNVFTNLNQSGHGDGLQELHALCIEGNRDQIEPLWVRAGDRRQVRAKGTDGVRGGNLAQWPHVRRGEKIKCADHARAICCIVKYSRGPR